MYVQIMAETIISRFLVCFPHFRAGKFHFAETLLFFNFPYIRTNVDPFNTSRLRTKEQIIALFCSCIDFHRNSSGLINKNIHITKLIQNTTHTKNTKRTTFQSSIKFTPSPRLRT